MFITCGLRVSLRRRKFCKFFLIKTATTPNLGYELAGERHRYLEIAGNCALKARSQHLNRRLPQPGRPSIPVQNRPAVRTVEGSFEGLESWSLKFSFRRTNSRAVRLFFGDRPRRKSQQETYSFLSGTRSKKQSGRPEEWQLRFQLSFARTGTLCWKIVQLTD